MGEKISFIQLKNTLESLSDKTKLVNIHIHKDVRYKKVIKILDLLQYNKLNNISFVTTN